MRKAKLEDLNPKFVRWDGRDGVADAVLFDCPERHTNCIHRVPFTPAMDGSPTSSPQSNKAHWQRSGETLLHLTLTPSIRCNGACHFHGFITNGQIVFCGDSR